MNWACLGTLLKTERKEEKGDREKRKNWAGNSPVGPGP